MVINTESFAFWYKKNIKDETGSEKVTAVMHLNLWTQCGWKGKNHADQEI